MASVLTIGVVDVRERQKDDRDKIAKIDKEQRETKEEARDIKKLIDKINQGKPLNQREAARLRDADPGTRQREFERNKPSKGRSRGTPNISPNSNPRPHSNSPGGSNPAPPQSNNPTPSPPPLVDLPSLGPVDVPPFRNPIPDISCLPTQLINC